MKIEMWQPSGKYRHEQACFQAFACTATATHKLTLEDGAVLYGCLEHCNERARQREQWDVDRASVGSQAYDVGNPARIYEQRDDLLEKARALLDALHVLSMSYSEDTGDAVKHWRDLLSGELLDDDICRSEEQRHVVEALQVITEATGWEPPK